MDDQMRCLVELQKLDSQLLELQRLRTGLPLEMERISQEIQSGGERLKQAQEQLEAVKLLRRKREKDLEVEVERVKKSQGRLLDVKTNKEYQAHLREIETFEHEIVKIEDQILEIMDEIDVLEKEKAEREKSVRAEEERIHAFKKKLDDEAAGLGHELSQLMEERAKIVSALDADVYTTYLTILKRGNGVAMVRAEHEICLGCNMNIPPQLFVEIMKNADLIQCPQCHRLLYYAEDGAAEAQK